MSAQDYVFNLVPLSRVEFKFTTYLNGTEVVEAVQNLNYKGGNTRTGAGLKFAADNFFNPASSRDVPKVWRLVLSLHVKTVKAGAFRLLHGSVCELHKFKFSDRTSLTFRLQSWSQMGNHRITWKILHRSYAVKASIFLRSVSATLSVVVVCAGKTFHLAVHSVWFV